MMHCILRMYLWNVSTAMCYIVVVICSCLCSRTTEQIAVNFASCVLLFKTVIVISLPDINHYFRWVVKIGTPKAGFEPKALIFWASVLHLPECTSVFICCLMLTITYIFGCTVKQRVGLASRMRGVATVAAEVEQLGSKVGRLPNPMS